MQLTNESENILPFAPPCPRWDTASQISEEVKLGSSPDNQITQDTVGYLISKSIVLNPTIYEASQIFQKESIYRTEIETLIQVDHSGTQITEESNSTPWSLLSPQTSPYLNLGKTKFCSANLKGNT